MARHDLTLSLLFAAWVIVLLCFVEWVVSLLSGWGKLARRFRCRSKFSGHSYRFQSGRLNLFYFRWSMEVGMNKEGLYMAPMIPVRLFCRPLLIPWEEIQARPYHKFVNRGYQLSLRSAPDAVLVLFGEAFRKSERFTRNPQNT